MMNATYKRDRLQAALKNLPFIHEIDYNFEQKSMVDFVTTLSDPDEQNTSKAAKERELIPMQSAPAEKQRDADEFALEVLKGIESEDDIDTTASDDSRKSKSPDLQQKVEAINSALTNSIEMQRLYKNESEAEFDELMTNNMDHYIDNKFDLIERWSSDRSKALKLYATSAEEVQVLENLVEKERELNDENVMDSEEISSDVNEAKNVTNIVQHQIHKKKSEIEGFDFELTGKSEMVMIGPHGTEVSRNALNKINWTSSGTSVTRKILCQIFDRNTLAFSSLTGKPSPAFVGCSKDKKDQLDPHKVSDLTFYITNKLNMTAREVRCAITTKCADENKLYRQKMEKLNARNKNLNKTI